MIRTKELAVFLLFPLVSWLMSGCSSSKRISTSRQITSITSVKFLDSFVLDTGIIFRNTTVGGLSGIDYDSQADQYYLICDDPSTKGPARFYTAKIKLSEFSLDTVIITNVTALRNPAGEPYADITKDRIHSADVEAMRFNPKRNEMIWASEGQKFIRPNVVELENPQIVSMDINGNYLDSFPLANNMRIGLDESGPRHNSVFEGLDFDLNYENFFVALEIALYDDGPRPGLGDSTSWVRILKYNRQSKRQIAQFAYKIDAAQFAPNPPNAFKINGISDILYLGNDKMIVVERSWSFGRKPSDIRLYLADLAEVTDVSSVKSLQLTPIARPIKKTLLLDLNSLGVYIDNIEGICIGPKLPNGNQSLVLVADDNFDHKQQSQFLLFEVLP